MKKLLLLGGIIILSGCLTMRNYTKEEPRKDLEIEGNQGCLSGECKNEPRENRLGDTRTISVMEVEFGPREIEKETTTEESVVEKKVNTKIPLQKIEVIEAVPQDELMSAVKTEIQYYQVQENDTLQKISHKFYGTTKEWNFLYEANKDILKSPDRLYPGIELLIPCLDN